MDSVDELADSDLLIRWRGGDKAAAQVLIQRYYPKLERFFMNKVTSDIGDLVQDTFYALVTKHDRISDNAKFRSYLFAIAYKLLQLRFRNEARRPGYLDVDRITAYDMEPGPSSVAARHEEEKLLLAALRRVPLNDQVLFELHYWEGSSRTEIADILGCSAIAIKGRLQRAHDRLRKTIADLATSPVVRDSTITNLQRWAQGIAAQRKPHGQSVEPAGSEQNSDEDA
ncbi:MAG: sigma-70 family RNA polymerase sigma factor [Proteobacteria bacterium]|nr:sigma-70 family RNA polymerase sigma factor [Pseudomonadota bacterium]